jgi:urease accessory protein UreF
MLAAAAAEFTAERLGQQHMVVAMVPLATIQAVLEPLTPEEAAEAEEELGLKQVELEVRASSSSGGSQLTSALARLTVPETL